MPHHEPKPVAYHFAAGVVDRCGLRVWDFAATEAEALAHATRYTRSHYCASEETRYFYGDWRAFRNGRVAELHEVRP